MKVPWASITVWGTFISLLYKLETVIINDALVYTRVGLWCLMQKYHFPKMFSLEKSELSRMNKKASHSLRHPWGAFALLLLRFQDGRVSRRRMKQCILVPVFISTVCFVCAFFFSNTIHNSLQVMISNWLYCTVYLFR